MCTVGDNDYEDSNQCMEEKASPNLVGALCKKCQTNKADVILRIKDTFCRECFLMSFTHKFRATLGKSKMIKPKDRVLVAVSGSPSSLALLQLVQDGIAISSPKRLQCDPYVVYIDEGSAINLTREQRQKVCDSIGEIVEQSGIPGYITLLEKCLDLHESNVHLCVPLKGDTHLLINEESDARLKALFNQLKSISSKEDLLQKLRHNLLYAVAEELECSKIFVGDSATDLAITILANLSLGRGAQLPYDVGFCDSRHLNVKLLRPMRDFLKKEIVYYNVFKKIESIRYPTFSTKVDPLSSIQKLTEKFITELQNAFPSTVSTIFRTGDKLSCEGDKDTESRKCVLCEAPIDTSKQKSSSLQATEFSQLISSASIVVNSERSIPSRYDEQHCKRSCDSESKIVCSCSTNLQLENQNCNAIKEKMCYGCRLIFKEMDSYQLLPSNIQNIIRSELNQRQLRKEIEDFLL